MYKDIHGKDQDQNLVNSETVKTSGQRCIRRASIAVVMPYFLSWVVGISLLHYSLYIYVFLKPLTLL